MSNYLKETERKIKLGGLRKTMPVSSAVLYVLMFFCFARDSLLLFGFAPICTMLFYGIFALTVLLIVFAIISLVNSSMTRNNILLLFFGLVIAAVLLAIAFVNSGLNILSNAKSEVSIIILLIFLATENAVQVDERMPRVFLYLNVALSLLMTARFFLPSAYFNSFLSFGLNNSNQAGATSMLCFCELLVLYILEKRRPGRLPIKIGLLILSAVMLVFCSMTGARSSFFSCILFLAVLVLCRRRAGRRLTFTVKVLVILTVIGPLLWLAFYFMMGAETDAEIFGKTIFSGREKLWLEVIRNVYETPFKMHYQEYVSILDRGAHLSAHNAMWNVMWNYTVFYMLATLVFMFIKFSGLCKTVKSRAQMAMIAVFCAMFLHMVFESVFISSAISYMLRGYLMIPLLRGVEGVGEYEVISNHAGVQRSRYLIGSR